MSQLGELAIFDSKFKAQNAVVVAISVDDPATSAKLLKKLEDRNTKLPFPLLSDSSRQLITDLGLVDHKKNIALPAILILDSELRVAWKYVGETIIDRPTPVELVKVLTHMRSEKIKSSMMK